MFMFIEFPSSCKILQFSGSFLTCVPRVEVSPVEFEGLVADEFFHKVRRRFAFFPRLRGLCFGSSVTSCGEVSLGMSHDYGISLGQNFACNSYEVYTVGSGNGGSKMSEIPGISDEG